MYQIILAPNEILRKRVDKQVDFSGKRLAKMVADMKDLMLSQKEPEGIGLAANQVGLPYRLFIARFGTKKTDPVHIFINPEIIDHSEETQGEDEDKSPMEGCLSIPNNYGVVRRYKNVRIKYQTLNPDGGLENREDTFANFPAVVIQHEVDHLDGKVFVERILEQKGKLYRTSGKDKKGKDKWEEVEI